MTTFLRNLSISKKLSLALLTAGLIPMIVVAFISMKVAEETIQEDAFSQLEAVRNIKADAISRYFTRVENQINNMAQSKSVVKAMGEFRSAFDNYLAEQNLDETSVSGLRRGLRSYYEKEFNAKYKKLNDGTSADIPDLFDTLDATAISLQAAYISENKYALGEKHQLSRAIGASPYHEAHAVYHEGIRDFLERFGYYDIFLVDEKTGDIVYSVFKELDFATSLLDGPYANTNFADAFKDARKLDKGNFVVKDYRPYLPSYDAPASFMASPIFDGNMRIGVLIFQMPLEPINEIMGERSGMGETGETYLVGEDRLMRSDSYLDPNFHSVSASFADPVKGSVNTEAVSAAFDGHSENRIITDYNGNPVFSSFAPLTLNQMNWAIIAEIDKKEAFQSIADLRHFILVAIFVISALLLVFAILMSRTFSSPIVKLSKVIRAVGARGDFSLRVDNTSQDEIGLTAESFNMLMENLSHAISRSNHVLLELGKGNFDERIEEEHAGEVGTLISGVNTAVTQVQTFSENAQKQTELAQEKSKAAEASAREAETSAQETKIIKQALDVSATAVMISDDAYRVIYQNQASARLMAALQADIQATIPEFNADLLESYDLEKFQSAFDLKLQGVKESTSTSKQDLHISKFTIAISSTPIFSDSKFLGGVFEWVDLSEELAKQRIERQEAQENSRIRQALSNSSTGTMIANDKHEIIFTNTALEKMFATIESDLHQHFSNVSFNSLQGLLLTNLNRESIFDKNSLDSLSNTESLEFMANSTALFVKVSPVEDKQHRRIGTVIEWQNRTEEVKIEKEIDLVVEYASKGEFNQQIDLRGKTGFSLTISEGLNRLLETTHIAIEDVMRIFEALAQGDLTQTMDREYSGQFQKLKTDANETIVKLRNNIGHITKASSTIAQAAGEISDGMRQLSSRTEQQAAALEETAASMDEMTSTVQQSEENAQIANGLTANSVEIAMRGSECVKSTTKSMQEISEASQTIASIISVIDEIAFQTNLLALNAAVEAARAGEQGRGFAVVAAEVRNLAQRSASSAKEIKDLILDSVNKVNGGTEVVQQSDEILKLIVTEIQKVSANMNDIVSSAREQSAGIGQVCTAITQMDGMTQENAALVEEVTAASESMASQSRELDTLVTFFRS